MREKPIENYLRKRVKEAGGAVYKWVSPGNRGVPDDLVFFSGMVFLVEAKSTTGVPSKLQLLQHRRLAGLGFDVVVLNSKEKVDQWISAQKSALELTVLGGEQC